jgi:hypothetical protein
MQCVNGNGECIYSCDNIYAWNMKKCMVNQLDLDHYCRQMIGS